MKQKPDQHNRKPEVLSDLSIDWNKLEPGSHHLHVYDTGDAFLDNLEKFTHEGIRAGEAVALILTASHKEGLLSRLTRAGLDTDSLMDDDQLMIMDAEASLEQFMVENWPGEDLFLSFVLGILERAYKRNRRLRAFGEMVVVLWDRGLQDATVRLEFLWDKFCKNTGIALLCAYPGRCFSTHTAGASDIHRVHSHHHHSPSAG